MEAERCEEWAWESASLRERLNVLLAEVHAEKEAGALRELRAAMAALEGADSWHACNAIVRVADSVVGGISQEVRDIVNARQDGRSDDEKWAAVQELLTGLPAGAYTGERGSHEKHTCE